MHEQKIEKYWLNYDEPIEGTLNYGPSLLYKFICSIMDFTLLTAQIASY